MPWKPVTSEPQSRMDDDERDDHPREAHEGQVLPAAAGRQEVEQHEHEARHGEHRGRRDDAQADDGSDVIGVSSAASRDRGHGGGRLRLYLGDQGAHARLGLAGERDRVDADPEDEDQHGNENRPLPERSGR